MAQAIFHHAQHRLAGFGIDDAVRAKAAAGQAWGERRTSVHDQQHQSRSAGGKRGYQLRWKCAEFRVWPRSDELVQCRHHQAVAGKRLVDVGHAEGQHRLPGFTGGIPMAFKPRDASAQGTNRSNFRQFAHPDG